MNVTPDNMQEILAEHLREDAEFKSLMRRVMFGDDTTSEIGLIKMTKEMHTVFTSSKSIFEFFGGIGGMLKWIVVIGAVVATIKGWWAGIASYALSLK